MANRRTNIFLSDINGSTVINDFRDTGCLQCILNCTANKSKVVLCPMDGIKRYVFFQNDDKGKLYVCDDKEKTVKNFLTLVELIKHSRTQLLSRYESLAASIQRDAFRELDALEHNIFHINSDAINEFYSFITQDSLVTNYRKLQELIEENIRKHPDEAVDLIAHLARYNLNIKTELSVVAKLNNPDGKPSLNIGKPRDAIMSSVYMLYPLFRKRHVYVNVGECWDKFDIDYDALQVASFYIIENATKYTEKGTNLDIKFTRSQHKFYIEFIMRSLFIESFEVHQIFDEGYRGRQAQEIKRGKGIGLYRARRLAHFFEGELSLQAGTEAKKGGDGRYYADNIFVIELPIRMPIR